MNDEQGADRQAGQEPGASPSQGMEKPDQASLLSMPHEAGEPQPASPRPGMHITHNPLGLISGLFETRQQQEQDRQQRNLEQVIHRLLIVGLALSSALMLSGLALDLLLHRDVPTAVPDLGEVISRLLALRPSGFLALGLIVLIATPILRVAGSVIAYFYERDWLYTAVTFTVLLIVIFSVLFGSG